ncbi:MAG: DNA modification system-associated small protein [Candidatus Woesearchaeota archaeon]
MDEKLKQLCSKYEISKEVINKIIKIEKDNVHKKRRQIFGDLRKIIDEAVDNKGDEIDYN